MAKEGIEIEDQEFYSGGSSLKKGRELTQAILERTPELDFLYYSNDMIGAGGLLHLLEKGIDVPGEIGLAGFIGVELLDGLPKRLATMDAGRSEIGREAARIIAARIEDETTPPGERIELTPKLQPGETLRRR